MKNYYTIKAKERPKWFQLRWRLSNWLISMAIKMYHENPEVKAYFMKVMIDNAICGGSVSHVNWKDVIKKNEEPK